MVSDYMTASFVSSEDLGCRERTLAGLNALLPRVIKLRVANVSALLEPIAAANTATRLARFFDSAAIGARSCRRGCCF